MFMHQQRDAGIFFSTGSTGIIHDLADLFHEHIQLRSTILEDFQTERRTAITRWGETNFRQPREAIVAGPTLSGD
jgi:hypothetical protein